MHASNKTSRVYTINAFLQCIIHLARFLFCQLNSFINWAVQFLANCKPIKIYSHKMYCEHVSNYKAWDYTIEQYKVYRIEQILVNKYIEQILDLDFDKKKKIII